MQHIVTKNTKVKIKGAPLERIYSTKIMVFFWGDLRDKTDDF